MKHTQSHDKIPRRASGIPRSASRGQKVENMKDKPVTAAELENRAKAIALAHLNGIRAAEGKPLLKRLSPLWWRLYGNQW